MVILGFIFDRQDSTDISLLEFEKDGCLLFSNNISYYKCIENDEIDSPFLEFIKKSGFKFKITEYNYYIRCNNTSWFWEDKSKLRMKGMYKHVPISINKFYEDIFTGNETNIKQFIDIYNSISLKFIRNNNLQTILEAYCFCGDNKILNMSGRYEKYGWKSSQIDTTLYQKTFIYPVWVFQQRNLAGVV
jgi:hypothetical protein